MKKLKVGMGTVSQKNAVLAITVDSSACPYATGGAPSPNCLFFPLANSMVGDEEPRCQENKGMVRYGEDVMVLCSLAK